MPRQPAQEITDALRPEILAGRLWPGDQVLSEHELARQFSTTRTSAQNAIAVLRAEGHLTSEHIAPEQTRTHREAREVTRDLLQLSGPRPRAELRELAERFGVLP
jgi:DNA-binding FadR family transcriptional regulator